MIDGAIRPGTVIKSSKWPEPVTIDLIEKVGEYYRVVGSTIDSHQHIDQLLSESEFKSLSLALLPADFSANPRIVFLGLEARRYRYAALYDPLLAVNISKVDPLPHQIESEYGYILRLPRIRFLIADDPGAGKTIMAGLVIKELKVRNQISKVMIVVPGHLRDQWRREMKERFEESFILVDKSTMESFFGENVWERETQIITSMDFAKQEEILPRITSADFDLVIIDEAHKMSAYQYGDSIDRTDRYRLGEGLSKITEHFLFLTATPHRGDPDNFRLFLDLLEPGFFATTEMLQESIRSQDNPLFIRRVKEDLKDFEGRPLFMPRYVKTLTYDLGVSSPKEKILYNELSEYVELQYNRALSKGKRRNITFALIILQRRLASSTYALLRSLERRKERLEELLKRSQYWTIDTVRFYDVDTTDDMSEEERWQEEEQWETLSVAENRDELKQEISTVEALIQRAQEIINKGDELKVGELKETLEQLERDYPGEKIIIFTEAKDTLDYLEKKIRSWGYTVNTIHGGMKLQERIDAEKVFKHETQILVATEAAGEGINLQFCHLMINFDLPWNPNRLEQRMGRIHRYGQTKEVFVFNLVAADTREGRVLRKLFDKLEEIRNALGSDKVYDVLSTPLHGVKLAHLMTDAAANARNVDEILAELDIEVNPEYIQGVKDQLGESLATRYIDYTRIKEMADRARERRLIPEYTEAFFKRAYDHLEGRLSDRADGYLNIESVPSELKSIAEKDDFKRSFGTLLKQYRKSTFDKTLAFKDAESEFISFGHPLFESMLRWSNESSMTGMQQGGTFTDPDGVMDGLLLFFEGEVRDGKNTVAGSRLFTLYLGVNDTEPIPIHSTILWDLKEGGSVEESETVDLEEARKKSMFTLIEELESYQQEILIERERQAAIKEKYGVESLKYLITRLDDDLLDLYDRQDKGENVDLAIHNKKERKRRYELALSDLRTNIEQEKALVMGTPRFIGSVRVFPEVQGKAMMKSDKEVELIGMQVSMEYEKKHGRVPEDVSAEYVGYDIRSRGENEIRYIEVKGRAGRGEVVLTQNEWFKAKRFGEDFYLYIVLDASSNPDMKIIRNPASILAPNEVIELVRYRIALEIIEKKGKAEIER